MPDFKKIEIYRKINFLEIIERIVPIQIISFFESFYNLIKWFPTIWKQREFDSFYLYALVQKKIEFQKKASIKYSENYIKEDLRYMDICLDLLEKVKEDYYSVEHMSYKVIEPKTEGKITKFVVVSERYSEYLKKYPSVVRKLRKRFPGIENSSLCFLVSKENHRRAKSLLFRIISEKSEDWWF